MRVLKTAPGEVLDVAFSPDCRAIAAAVDGAGVFLWNLDSPTIAPVRLETGGRYRSGGLSFSADGRRLGWMEPFARRAYDRDTRATVVLGYSLSFMQITSECADATGTRTVTNHTLPEQCLVGWKWVEDEWVRQWHLPTRHLSVASLAYAPGGDRFAMLTRQDDRSADHPWRLDVRDATTSAAVAAGTYPYSYSAKVLRFHPAGEQVAGINEMTLLAWALPAGGDPRLVRNDNRKHFTALAYHPTGRTLFATSNDTTVHVFDARSLDRVSRHTWHLDKLSAVAVSPDGTLAAAGSANGDVVVWDLD
jgi:WD40 repeat protein